MPSEEEFYDKQRGQTTYLSIISTTDKRGRPQAVIAEPCNEGDKGAVSRLNKNQKTVWERHHPGIQAVIKGVYVKKHDEWGDQLYIRFKTKTIQVPMSSSHARTFIAIAPNIDLTQPVLFEPWKMPKTDKNGKPVLDSKGAPKFNQGWTLKQGGDEKENKVEPALDLSKDGPVPAFKKLKNGKFDTSDHDEFLLDYLKDWIKENDLDKKPDAATDNDDDDEETDDEEEEYDSAAEDEDDDNDESDEEDEDDVVETKKLKKKLKRSNSPF